MFSDQHRTRRSVLTAALAAVAASIAGAVRAPFPVRAAGSDGATITVGGFFPDAQSQTTVANKTNAERVLWVASNDDLGAGDGVAVTGYSAKSVGVEGWGNGTGAGVYGHSVGHGVQGESSMSSGVYGKSTATNGYGISGEASGSGGTTGVRGWVGSSTGMGVEGFAGSFSGATIGVHGYAASTGGTGVLGEVSGAGSTFGVDGRVFGSASVGTRGWSNSGTGVLGYSGLAPSPTAIANVGVFGQATQDTTSRGVYGKSTSGRGVFGEATSGQGVRGNATSGSGVYGYATTGYALRTSGRLRFEKVSGVATIAASATTAPAIAPGTDITTASYVLLTPQSDPGTRRFWATLDTAANTITIHTNATSASAIRIAWLLVQ